MLLFHYIITKYINNVWKSLYSLQIQFKDVKDYKSK